MSFEVVKASLPMFFSGLKLTLLYSFLGIAGSIVIGLACSLVKYFKIAVLKRIVSAYVELARNTPLLIQLFFLYYAFPVIGLKMSASTCGIVGLIFLGGAYMAEGFNGGLDAVSKSNRNVESTACILRRFSSGTCVERSCTVGKHHFFDQGNVDFFRDCHSGTDEYGA